MKAAQIRKHLQKQSGTLFFSPAERALLAILDDPSYAQDRGAIINADYTKGCVLTEKRVRRIIEQAWNDEAAA